MSETRPDAFKRNLGLLDLTMIGFGSIFGSGWLFAAAHVADVAGPASILSWIIGGVAVLLLGVIYCELGAALPVAGGVVRFPETSHGPVAGFLMGLITTIAFTSLIAIEIVAARQYAGAWIPGLNRDAAGNPTLTGWCLQTAVLAVLYAINRRGIATFALINNIVTVFKFCVPGLVIILLLAHMHGANFSAHGFAPHGASGVQVAVSTGGIIFAYLGLTPILAVASEVKNPQRTIPIALVASVALSTLVYVLLQTAFIGSLPASELANGWNDISSHLPLPFHDIAVALGLGALATLVVIDAILSPTGTGNIYLSATPRVVYAWAKGGTLPALFSRVDAKTGVPGPALALSFALALFWTLPFPSWQALISVVSSALMLSYALAPTSAAGLRHSRPDMARPFRVRGFGLLSPLSFGIATLIVLWAGWNTLRWLMPTVMVLALALMAWRATTGGRTLLRADIRSSSWMLVYFLGLFALSWAGPFGGRSLMNTAGTDVAGMIGAFALHEWARRAAIR
ncbi:APC family permease [Brytella acorum]|uniref:APC family permease n=1 Tax=Brytella acorum TaxID=2959299 RepID=A0AA35VD55_9PROT|nr:APC family permease [Brytella acorum]MDF3624299.1 APC family permease [Brytella acorum]CAI9121127.1 APC family permease [Brytella acorum]